MCLLHGCTTLFQFFVCSPLEPIDPVLESPLAHPLLKQKMVAAELLNEVSVLLM